MQKVIGRMASSCGFEFLPISSGEEALKAFEDKYSMGGEDNLPAVVLMDLTLPDMSGCDTIRLIKEKYPQAILPIITVTACGSVETIRSTFEAGACDIIFKPFTRDNLLSRIGAQLASINFWKERLESLQNATLLRQVFPKHVIKRLKQGEHPIYDNQKEVSVIFTDIVSFTSISAAHPTQEIIQMLHALFSEFDKLTDEHGVYKVETIGESHDLGHCSSSSMVC